jgi:hypothetical protein
MREKDRIEEREAEGYRRNERYNRMNTERETEIMINFVDPKICINTN